MSEPNQETYADISDELRTLSKSSKYCELQPTVEGRPISVYFAELADRIVTAEADIVSAELQLYPRTPGTVWGVESEYISAPRRCRRCCIG